MPGIQLKIVSWRGFDYSNIQPKKEIARFLFYFFLLNLVTEASRGSRVLKLLGFGVIDDQVPSSEVRGLGKLLTLTSVRKFRSHLNCELGDCGRFWGVAFSNHATEFFPLCVTWSLPWYRNQSAFSFCVSLIFFPAFQWHPTQLSWLTVYRRICTLAEGLDVNMMGMFRKLINHASLEFKMKLCLTDIHWQHTSE